MIQEDLGCLLEALAWCPRLRALGLNVDLCPIVLHEAKCRPVLALPRARHGEAEQPDISGPVGFH